MKHFKFEDQYYKKFLTNEDLLELKNFISKIEISKRPKSVNKETKVIFFK